MSSRRKSSLASVQREGLTGEDLDITGVLIDPTEGHTEHVDSDDENDDDDIESPMPEPLSPAGPSSDSPPLPMSPLTDHGSDGEDNDQELNSDEHNGDEEDEEESELPHAPFKRNYSCVDCDYHTQNPRAHLYHLRDVHGVGGRIYECKYCVYASNHSQKLNRHIDKCHGPPVLKPAIEEPVNPNAKFKPVKPEPFHFLKNLLMKEKEEKAAAKAASVKSSDDENSNEEVAVATKGDARVAENQGQGEAEKSSSSSSSSGSTSSSSSSGSDSESGSSRSRSGKSVSDSDQEETAAGEEQKGNKNENEEPEELEDVEGDQVGEDEEEVEEDEAQHGETAEAETGGESSTPLHCTICNYSTKIRSRFTKHVRYHSMPLIKCTYCDFKTPYKWNLDRHNKSHTGDGALTCPLCNFSSDIKQSITVHIQNHHEGLTPEKVLQLVQSLDKDKTQGQAVQDFSARIPGQVRKGLTVQRISTVPTPTTRAPAKKTEHKPKANPPNLALCPNVVYYGGMDGAGGEEEEGSMEVNCEYCSETFGSHEELQFHQSSCEGLAKIQEWNGGLLWNGNEDRNDEEMGDISNFSGRTGIKRNYGGNQTNGSAKAPVTLRKKVYKCPYPNCAFWAITPSRFHVHMVGHNNSKPFECSICGYKSNWRWDIAKHIKLKTPRDKEHLKAEVIPMDQSADKDYQKYDKYMAFMNVKVSNADLKLPDCSTKANKMGDIETEMRDDDEFAQRNGLASNTQRAKAQTHIFLKPTDYPNPTRRLLNPNYSHDKPFGTGKRTTQIQHQMGTSAPEAKKPKLDVNEQTSIIWKCKKCSYRDTNKDALFAHLRQHHSLGGTPGTRPRPTSILKQTPGQVQQQQQPNGPIRKETHQYTTTKDGHFTCKFCPFKARRVDFMIVHSQHHFSNPNCTFSCDYCSYNIDTQEGLNEHLLLHENAYANETDGTVPESKISESGASRTVKNSPSTSTSNTTKKYTCSECPYVTDSKGQFHYHSQFHLNREGIYKCGECSYNVSHKHLLHQHVRVHRSSNDQSDSLSIGDLLDQVIVCELCPARFFRIADLKIHSVFHMRDALLQCPECSYSVKRLPHLHAHLKVHTPAYQQRTEEYLSGTANVHTNAENQQSSPSPSTSSVPSPAVPRTRFQEGDDEACEGNPEFVYPTYIKNGRVKEKRYKCKKCPSAFEKRDQYRVHIGLHGSKQRYQCTVCDYAVTFYANFMQHLKKHKNQANIPPELLVAHPISKRSAGPSTSSANKDILSCEFCEFETKQKHLFDDHMNVMHPEEKRQQEEMMDYDEDEDEEEEEEAGQEGDSGDENEGIEDTENVGGQEGYRGGEELLTTEDQDEGNYEGEYEDGNAELMEDEEEEEIENEGVGEGIENEEVED